MHKLTTVSAAVILVLLAGPAAAATHEPVSDSIIGPISLAPKSPAEVKQQCDTRLAAIGTQQTRLEAMPLATDAATLFAAYDDVYNLVLRHCLYRAVSHQGHPPRRRGPPGR